MENDTRTHTDLYNESIRELEIHFLPSIAWIAIGVIALAEHLALFSVIHFSSKLSSSHLRCIKHLAFADAMCASAVVSVGLKRIVLLKSGLGEVSTPLRCAVDVTAIAFGITAMALQTAAMSVDCLIAVAAPVWKLTLRSALRVCCLQYHLLESTRS